MENEYWKLARRYFALLAALVFFLPVAVFGQVVTATVTGVVTDQQGAVIPAVKISVKNVGTAVTREIQTNSGGEYVVPLLPVGTYTVTAEKEGFKSATISGITLAAGDNARENIQLQIGQVTQSVEVSGAPPALQTENASLGTLINPTATEELPLNGRNVEGLTLLIPGANQGQSNSMASGNRPDDRRPTSAVSINGQDTQYNDFLIDGTDNNERNIGTLIVKPQIDALAEVKIDTDNYSAAASRTAGGVVNFVTKSGTDQFHGSVYEFLRETRLDARNFFDLTNRLPYHQNQYGGSLGGPIQKGKTFFFGDYEGLRVHQGLSYVNTIPTAAMKQGNFQGVNHIFNPFTNSTVGGVTTRQEFDTPTYGLDVIPPASACSGPDMGCMDPITSQVVNLYPATNAAGLANNNYEGENKVLNTYTFDGRIDHAINAKNMIFGRYSYNHSFSDLPGTMPPASYGSLTGVIPGGGNGANYWGSSPELTMNQTLGWTRVFSPTFVMDLRAAYSRFHVQTLPANYGKDIDSELGIPNGNAGDIYTTGMSLFAPSGFAFMGDQGFEPEITIDNGWEGLGNFTWQHGSHSVKFGGRFERRLNETLQSASNKGVFTFDNNFTNDPTKSVYPGVTTGNAIASFLLGIPSGTSRGDSLVAWGPRMIEAGLYVQDDWQVTKSLTVNLGVRWDYFPFWSDQYGRVTNLDLQANPPVWITGNTMSHAGVDTGHKEFGPRIGFAKRFGSNTVLRGGYGISFDPYQMGSWNAMRNAPWVALYTLAQTTITPGNYIEQGFPLPVPLNPQNPIGTSHVTAFNYPNSSAQQWNLTAERNFNGFVFRLAYVGVVVRHAWMGANIDQALPGLGAVAPRRPFYSLWPSSGDIDLSEDGATANYHALQFTVERRYKNGFSLLANYTYSRALDDGNYFGGSPETEGNTPPEYYPRLAEEYGLSDLNCSQRVAISGLYELPWGKSLKGFQGVLGKGWQVNGIMILQSGFPFTALNNAAEGNTGDPDRPNQVGNWHEATPTVHAWFNKAAFAPQTAGTLGSVGRDTMIGPSFKNLDMSIFKNFKLSERFNLQFRAECFNLPNHANFDLPGNAIGASSAGVISDTANNLSREFQFALKLSF